MKVMNKFFKSFIEEEEGDIFDDKKSYYILKAYLPPFILEEKMKSFSIADLIPIGLQVTGKDLEVMEEQAAIPIKIEFIKDKNSNR